MLRSWEASFSEVSTHISIVFVSALTRGYCLGAFIGLMVGLAAKKRERLGIKPDLYDIFKL